MMFILCLQYNYAGHLDRRDNTKLIEYLKTVCNDKLGEYDYYQGSKMVKIGFYDYSYFFVDMQPGAGWEHPCKHLYCRAASPLFSADTLIVYDGMRPLPDADLIPLSVKDRYGAKSRLKAKVAKLPANAGNQNKFSGNTYAVILSGGMNKDANEERYWNDCSFLYQTLRNHYNISRKNIKVIMADGTDPAADMKTVDNEYISSPLDLDGDGTADIDYAATRENVASVIKELSSKMTDKDHLLLFVVDHGGYDKQKQQSYICLWGDAKLYPDELNDCLKAGDAGYVSIVMGQCHSGGFVESLKGNNRVIATACAENELSFGNEDIPFDEFVYRWTSALNGYDAEGNKVAEVQNAHGFTTITDAARYAQKQDMYTDGKFPYAEETPQLSWLTNSTAEDLALDTIPPTVYLYITKGNSKAVSFGSGKIIKFMNGSFWDSSDIWLRNQADGLEIHEHEMPKVTENHKVVYIYTRIKNRGVKSYPGYGTNIRTWWARSSYVIDQYAWKGYRDTTMIGGEVDDATVEDVIAPGESYIVETKYEFKSNRYKFAKDRKFNMCLLSFLADDDESQSMPVNDLGIAKAWATDRLGQKNRCTLFALRDDFADMVMSPVDLSCDKMTIAVLKETEDVNLDIKLTVPKRYAGSLLLKGCNTIKAYPQEIHISGVTAYIEGFSAVAEKNEFVRFSASVVADRDIMEEKHQNVDVVVIDEASGEVIGGEKFDVVVKPRPKIVPTISKTIASDGMVQLAAGTLDEDVSYEWYDKDGNLVGTDRTLSVSQISSAGEYTLRVSAKSDNASNTAKTTVEKKSFIKEVDLSASGKVNADFTVPSQKGMTARLSSLRGNSPVVTDNIEEGVTHVSFSVPNISSEMLLTIEKDGKIIDECKIMKR